MEVDVDNKDDEDDADDAAALINRGSVVMSQSSFSERECADANCK